MGTMLDIIDHTNHPSWTPINKRLGRENGARTYSVDIVKFYAPVFEKVFLGDEKVLLITVQNWNSMEIWSGYDKIFVFVHERGGTPEVRREKLEGLKNFAEANSKSEVWFICWCPQHEKEIRDAGLNGFYLPMGIDTEIYKPYREVPKMKNNRIVYFGNIIHGKKEPFKDLKQIIERKGWKLDYISLNKFNGVGLGLTIEECRRILSKYQYGVAVGRSAQELSAMGLKVFCYAYGDVMFPNTDEKAKRLLEQNNTSWGEGISLEELGGLLTNLNLGKLKPIYRDCRDTAKELESKLQQIKDSAL